MKHPHAHWFGWIFLCGVVLFFIPRWYVLSYTKLWELKQLVKQEREGQMQIMHPADQMGQLLALKSHLQQNYSGSEVVIILPEIRTLPLSQNPAIVRGVLTDRLYDLHISTSASVSDYSETACLYIGEASSEAKLLPSHCTFWRGK